MTSGLGLEIVGDVSPANLSPDEPYDLSLHIPKNKSTGNLLSQNRNEDIDPPGVRDRHSIDAGTGPDVNNLKRNIRNDDPMGGASGLRRIRRGPPSRTPTLMFDPEYEFLAPPLYHAQTLPISGSSSRSASRSASTAQFVVNTAISPIIEDLQRFPSESLHSFSFARQSEDFLHSRQAILTKSVELIRDQRSFIANAGLVSAEARVRGDVEMQGMMDLLKRAKVVPQLDIPAANNRGLVLGPLTGPAYLDGKNPFEKSFDTTPDAVDGGESSAEDEPLEIPAASNESAIIDSPDPSRPHSPSAPRKLGLRRTYTDTKSLSLQQTLLEALAQPYTSVDAPLSQAQDSISFLPNVPTPQSAISLSQAVHTHSSKWMPPAQAFFRTDADTPWTIQAANDLACLTFGITRAEVRSLSILGLIEPGQRQWLEDKLKQPDPVDDSPRQLQAPELKNGSLSMLGGKGGITARLLSKAPSRAAKNQRAQTDDGSGGYNKPVPSKNHPARKSRGVLLCGEILPIQKRDGTLGAASFWVMEKRGGFIWIIEQVIEDVAYLSYDKSWRITDSRGDDEQIWGEPLRTGLKLKYLLPKISLSALSDGELGGASYTETFTAATMGGVNVPTSVTKLQGKDELRVSSLPHIAGIMVLDPETLKITSSNAVFSQALFGYSQPNGMLIDDLIFNFEAIIDVLEEDEEQNFLEGLVIPEHSFRRARALLALREGKEDAANIFLRPSGLPARHRDGTDIMVDVQMRIVRSESLSQAVATEDVIVEENDEGTLTPAKSITVSSLVYALWITYSRQLHSAGMGVARPEHPLASRPATPPPQPAPQPDSISSPPTDLHLTTSSDLVISRQNTLDPSPIEPLEHPPPSVPFVPHPRKKIMDFIILEDMGSGAYGEVKLARYQSSRSSKVVIKYVTKKKILVDTWTRDRKLGTVPLEIHVLDFLRRDGNKHPNIVEMLDFFEDDINYYIEMVPHGLPGMDLFDYIELRMNMTESEIRHIFQQVVSAISHLHTHAHIVHRDIKDENVVLDGENRVKLIDFGSAAYIKNGPFDVFVGTIDYAAPEVLQGKPYGGCEQDVWALGILLYTIVFKENPFYNIDEILDHPLRLPEDGGESIVALDCVELIKGMLDRDVDERLNIEEVKQHPWLKGE